ncbi:hypothetical protein [Streptomyces sp. NPDC047453]
MPIYAFGPGADVFGASQDNTDLYRKMYTSLFRSQPVKQQH